MRWVRLPEPEGGFQFCDWTDHPDTPLPKGGVELPRKPEPGEDYTPKLGWHTPDPVGLANYNAGPEHIAEARQAKYLEAVMIASGVKLTSGLLAQEAALQSRNLEALAMSVLAKRRAFEEQELDRQTAQIT